VISQQSVLQEFDVLIAQAESFEVERNPQVTSSYNWVQDRVRHHQIIEPIVRDVQGFEQWKYQVATFVDHALPLADGTKVAFVVACRTLLPGGIQSTIGRLRGLRESFARGYYRPLQQRVYAEVGGTYLNEAEGLLSSVDKSDLKEANTACLYAGIALESQLVSLCAAANIDIKKKDGQRKKAAELLEQLKDAGTVDANTAKRLHTYLELRNQSAHGNWEQVSEIAVKEMIVGVRGLING
jgi:uncharacterized protein YutE (UPF0331/DUF86 family)